MVSEESTWEDISGIPRDQAGHRAVVKVGVRHLGFLEAFGRPVRHQVHGESAVRGHVVPGLELVHVQGPAVVRDVEIVAGVGGVGFDEVVRADQASGLAWDRQ